MHRMSWAVYLYNALEKRFEEHEYYQQLEDAVTAQRDYARWGILSTVAPIGEEFTSSN